MELDFSAVPDLCRRFHVRRLDLFGSAADGRFDPVRSDLDFLVTFEDTPDIRAQDAYFGLLNGLGELFGREIDLLTDRSMANPYLRHAIERQRRQLYPDEAPALPNGSTAVTKDEYKHVWDARRAAQAIIRYAQGRTFDAHLEDDMFRSAVERQFEIIGEAFVRIRGVAPDLAASIPVLPRVVAFRNILVHNYDEIDHDVVWRVVTQDVPALLVELNRLLDGRAAPA